MISIPTAGSWQSSLSTLGGLGVSLNINALDGAVQVVLTFLDTFSAPPSSTERATTGPVQAKR